MVTMQRGYAQRTLSTHEPVRSSDHAPSGEFWSLYLRGLAYLRLKDGQSAIGQFRSILDHRGEVPASMLYPLASLGAGRAAALVGDTEAARKAYDQFFALWKDADADLQAVKDARAEYARLR
jgi:hypothetical protein